MPTRAAAAAAAASGAPVSPLAAAASSSAAGSGGGAGSAAGNPPPTTPASSSAARVAAVDWETASLVPVGTKVEELKDLFEKVGVAQMELPNVGKIFFADGKQFMAAMDDAQIYMAAGFLAASIPPVAGTEKNFSGGDTLAASRP